MANTIEVELEINAAVLQMLIATREDLRLLLDTCKDVLDSGVPNVSTRRQLRSAINIVESNQKKAEAVFDLTASHPDAEAAGGIDQL